MLLRFRARFTRPAVAAHSARRRTEHALTETPPRTPPCRRARAARRALGLRRAAVRVVGGAARRGHGDPQPTPRHVGASGRSDHGSGGGGGRDYNLRYHEPYAAPKAQRHAAAAGARILRHRVLIGRARCRRQLRLSRRLQARPRRALRRCGSHLSRRRD